MSNMLRGQQTVVALGAIALVVACAAPSPAAARNPFDGKWTMHNSSKTCMVKSNTWTLIVRNGAVTAPGNYPPTGSISETGRSHWTRTSKKDGLPVIYSGTFHGNVGSGGYVSSSRVPCTGRFSARRK
ncbi:MAG: hypothetical protein ACREB8_00490 [Pseudolabrys sp.]